MMDDNLGDWRIRVVTFLAEDLPAAGPGAPFHKAGTPVYQSTTGDPFGFISPSVPAMCLNIAINASMEAEALKDSLILSGVTTPRGLAKSVNAEHSTPLYDYFEKCMASIVFSFMAIEAYSNLVIRLRLKDKYQLKRKDRILEVDAEELQRIASIEEKVATILPEIRALPSPKGRKVWENFMYLKEGRDATVHLKSIHEYPAARGLDVSVDTESLFHYFINSKMNEIPCASIRLLEYFESKEKPQRWMLNLLQYTEKQIGNKQPQLRKMGRKDKS